MHKFSEEYIKKSVGKIILEKRKAIKLSQECLAEKLGINIRTMSNIENGHTFISAKTLSKLCDIFNMSPSVFFDISNYTNLNSKLNEIIDKLRNSNNKDIDFYYDLINLVEQRKYKSM